MAKDHSDVFICRHARGGYWAHPSPFVAHGGGFEIQFRNLTQDVIEIDFRDAPVHKKTLSLAPRAADYVIVNGDAQSGLYPYRAEVRPARAAGRRKARAVAGQAPRKAAKAGPILVKGGSPPTVIIDT
jgi:hypothetical protein